MTTKRKTSFLWEHFQQISDSIATCNLCERNISFKTSTSNLKRHIDRRHPSLLNIHETNISDVIEVNGSNFETGENMENILIECYDESDLHAGKSSNISQWKSTSKKRASTEKLHAEKNKLNIKFSSLADSRNELMKIEIETAKKDLELKESQLLYARRDDERKQREHEINLKIKEAELEIVLSRLSGETGNQKSVGSEQEHEITLKIKEALLQAILSQKINVQVDKDITKSVENEQEITSP